MRTKQRLYNQLKKQYDDDDDEIAIWFDNMFKLAFRQEIAMMTNLKKKPDYWKLLHAIATNDRIILSMW